MSPILATRAGVSAIGYGMFGGGAPATAFESIATATGTGSSSTITFSSIPSTYQHLQIRMFTRGTGAEELWMQFNGNTSSIYTSHSLRGNGTTTAAQNVVDNTEIRRIGYSSTTTDIGGVSIIDIHDYASTSKTKVVRAFFGYDLNGSGIVWLSSGLWNSTSAITSISILTQGSNFATNATFALYGIKGA